MPKLRSSCFVGAALLLCGAADAQSPPANYDEAKVGSYALPNPLIFNNGKPVRSAKDWKKRRPELLQLFAENVYGHSPQPPEQLHYEVFDTDEHALNGQAIRKQITIYFSEQKDGPKEDMLLYIPAHSNKPVPVILSLNFYGNQSVLNDPAVKLATIWAGKTHQRQQAGEDSRGQYKGFEVEKILSRGYGFATICYQDIEPDFKGGIAYGIRPLFFGAGQTEPKPDEWGAIGAWSYGLSRAMDYLEKDNSVDAHRVAIMGHSRLGKTILWAGAMDGRFALVLASCSGEGGASLARRNYGETVRNLVNSFPYWFCMNFEKYAENVNQLPVDMHELIALIAPRPVYITGAEEDRWADPKGEFLACVAAGPVYRLLGVQGLGTDQMPSLNQPIMRTIGYHYRTGKHEVTAFDWDQFLTFADMHLQWQSSTRLP
ncbi:MAG: acetylxylan esterase [Acidobacteriaceae bacterium]|nr:acetylxylan esterase [Acidobacteriaceae bacterium]